MALNSYDDILAACSAGRGYEIPFVKTPGFTTVAGNQQNLWWTGGMPAAGGYAGGSNGVNNAQGTNSGAAAAPGTYYMGDCTNSTAGALTLPFTVDDASSNRPHITGVGAMTNVTIGGLVYVVDRIADSGQLTVASGSTGTIVPPRVSPAWARSSDGKGVMMWIESSSSAPGGASTFTLTYTGVRADGTTAASQTTGTITLAATAHRVFTGAGGGPFIPLTAGMVGVAPANISINTVGTATLTNVSLVVGRLLAVVPLGSLFQYVERDYTLQTPRLPKLEVSSDDTTSCIELIAIPSTAGSPTTLNGVMSMVVG